jgi:Glycosyltransferase sugar-binding region containing DXD motif
MIPNILHFVFGMAPDFGGKPFSLVHYLSVKSAVELNKPTAAIFHYQFEPACPAGRPESEWWEKTKSLITLNKIAAPDSFMGQPLYHVAHKADVVRLQALKETGGIYLDLDTISVKPLTDLLNHSFAIGQELKAAYVPKNWRQRIKYKLGLIKESSKNATGLCNAVLLSEKNSEFVNLWLDEYKTFRSKGRDKYWNEHSVHIPERLAALHPDSIAKLSPYAFHYPLYDKAGLKLMFEEVNAFSDAYLHHLWESFSWDQYLSKLTIEKIKTENTTYNLIARKYL